MRIAIPLVKGKLSPHFGHCEEFALIDVDKEEKSIVRQEMTDAPPHQPGLLPPWLAEQGVNLVIAGGMGMRAVDLFKENDIDVVIGAPLDEPEVLAEAFLAGTLSKGENLCDH